MARSDKVAMCIMRYMVPLIFVVEFIAIAALAWSLGGPRWAFGAVAAVALMLLFSYAFCCMAAVSDRCVPTIRKGSDADGLEWAASEARPQGPQAHVMGSGADHRGRLRRADGGNHRPRGLSNL